MDFIVLFLKASTDAERKLYSFSVSNKLPFIKNLNKIKIIIIQTEKCQGGYIISKNVDLSQKAC